APGHRGSIGRRQVRPDEVLDVERIAAGDGADPWRLVADHLRHLVEVEAAEIDGGRGGGELVEVGDDRTSVGGAGRRSVARIWIGASARCPATKRVSWS